MLRRSFLKCLFGAAAAPFAVVQPAHSHMQEQAFAKFSTAVEAEWEGTITADGNVTGFRLIGVGVGRSYPTIKTEPIDFSAGPISLPSIRVADPITSDIGN